MGFVWELKNIAQAKYQVERLDLGSGSLQIWLPEMFSLELFLSDLPVTRARMLGLEFTSVCWALLGRIDCLTWPSFPVEVCSGKRFAMLWTSSCAFARGLPRNPHACTENHCPLLTGAHLSHFRVLEFLASTSSMKTNLAHQCSVLVPTLLSSDGSELSLPANVAKSQCLGAEAVADIKTEVPLKECIGMLGTHSMSGHCTLPRTNRCFFFFFFWLSPWFHPIFFISQVLSELDLCQRLDKMKKKSTFSFRK